MGYGGVCYTPAAEGTLGLYHGNGFKFLVQKVEKVDGSGFHGSSHQQARRVADEVWYFHKGKLLEAGPKEQVLDTPEKAETRQFLEFYGV